MLVSHHAYYPDEIFQSLEQSYRLVHGVGIKPWDVIYGLRSFVLPLLLAIPLKAADLLHISSPEIYRFFPQTLLIMLSLAIPIAGNLLIRQFTTKKHAPQFAAIALATWYELIYMSGRALTESVSLDCFAIAVIFLYQKSSKPILAALFLTLGFFLRPQFFPIALALGFVIMQRKQIQKSIPAAVIGILIFGIVDWIYTGNFLSHLYRNLTLSFSSGISSLFGSQPWYFYLATLTISSSGLWLSTWFIPRQSKARILQYILLAIMVVHSSITHKEYRFIFALIPIWIMVFTVFIHHQFIRLSPKKNALAWQYATIGWSLVSLLGMFHRLPMEYRVYGQPPLFTDPIFAIYNRLSAEPVQCGIFNTSRNWVYTPGYYGTNKQVSLYSTDSPPPNEAAADYYIIPQATSIPSGFVQIMRTNSYQLFSKGKAVTVPGSMVLKRIGPCKKDAQYSTNRSSPKVDSILQSIHAQPVIH